MPRPRKSGALSVSERAAAHKAEVIARGGARRTVLLSPEAEAQVEPKMQAMGVTTFRALVEGWLMRGD